MSVSNSATDIVNLCMDIMKTENINDVEMPGNDKIAATANRWFDDIRQETLEGFPWNFANKRDAIPLNAQAPDFGFDDAYVLPNDYLSINFIEDYTIPLSKWNYVIEGNDIFIDNGGATTLDIGYVYDNKTTVKFSPSYKIYLAHALAEAIVYQLTGNLNLQTRISSARVKAEAKAKAKNGLANPPIAYRESRMLTNRRRYGSGRTSYGRPNGRA